MAKVMIVLEDQMNDGREGVNMTMQTDRQGLPKEAPPTDAMMAALTIARLWNSRALGNMIGLVSADAIHKRDQVMAQLRQQMVQAKNPAPVAVPPSDPNNEDHKSPPDGAFEKVAELKAAEVARFDQAQIAKARAEARLVDAEEPPAPPASPAPTAA